MKTLIETIKTLAIVGTVAYTVITVSHDYNSTDNQVDSTINQESCMPVTLSGAGSPDLRADINMKFDVVVCQNNQGQAVINNNYDEFVNDMIAENEEWK